jgi:hypothetical protein
MCPIDLIPKSQAGESGDAEKENQMKQTRGESTSTSTGIGETKGEGIGHIESMTISESHSEDVFERAALQGPSTVEGERRPRTSGWSGEPQESVTVLIEGGGFSFNDVFPMESRSSAAQFGREIASHALKLVAHPLSASRRRRSPGRQVEE